METSRLEIGCLAARYLVAADHPAPQQVKSRLDGIMGRDLPRKLERAFAARFSEQDQSIWIIRQINLKSTVNVTADADSISRTLAAQLAQNLDAAIHDGNQNNVRYFPNRAAYLASFLSDLAFDAARRQWYYESFEGLNALPRSAALRTAICAELETGKSALNLLAAAELIALVQCLTGADARVVLERLAQAGPAGAPLACREGAIRTAATAALTLAKLVNEWQRALWLFIEAGRADVTLGGAALMDAAYHAAMLAARPFTDAVKYDQQAQAHTETSSSPPEINAGAKAQTSAPRSTPFGGLFLLLPLLDELPLAQATRDWPQFDGTAGHTVARFLILLKCCGSACAQQAFYDPLLRDILLIPSAFSAETLRAWQAGLTRQHLRSFLACLYAWQRAAGAIGDRQHLLTVSRIGARPVLVWLDAARGYWLLLESFSTRRRQRIIAALRAPLADSLAQDGALYSDAALAPLLREHLPGLNIIAAAEPTSDPPDGEAQDVSAILARRDKLPDELEFVGLPRSFKITQALDLVLSVAAQHLLRALAWRLPGFARSNLPYLARNFLEFSASIEEEPVRRIVRIGRPSLNLVLNLTGMTRQSYRLSWLDERPIALFQGD
jgi:hypothetical protein